MQIFHIAEKSRWDAAKLAGAYAQSTYGRSLEDEGFIHACREDQWQGVRDRYYAGAAETLTLLVIDTDRLTSPWSEEEVGDTTYPHIHGPLNPSAVVREVPLPGSGATRTHGTSFARLFLTEILVRMLAGVLVMALAIAGYYAAEALFDGQHGLLGLALGVLIAIAILTPVLRRRSSRLAPGQT